jgi:lysozyme
MGTLRHDHGFWRSVFMRTITPRIAIELIAHEGIAREAYKDSVGVWTWSVGVTDASGHVVFPRYKDQPQPLEHCLGVYLWLLRTRYLPPVLAAFGSHEPTEAELGAALSFHWNTGAISRASWIARFVRGHVEDARRAMLEWARPASLLERRKREAALFFDGTWTNDGTARVYAVSKPGYRPTGAKRVDIRPVIEGLFASNPAKGIGATSPSWFDRLFT